MLTQRTRRLTAAVATLGVGVMGLTAAASASAAPSSASKSSAGTTQMVSSNGQDTGVNLPASTSKSAGAY